MENNINPILNFRLFNNKDTKDCFRYDLNIGARVNNMNQLIIDSSDNQLNKLSSLITETREAIDSVEHS